MGDQGKFSVHSPAIWFGAYLMVSFICRVGMVRSSDINVELVLRLESAALGFIAAVSVARDTAKTRGYIPADWMFLLWFILFPLYLLVEKGWRGVLWLLSILFLLGVSVIAPELLR
jgi:hypothetical protein